MLSDIGKCTSLTSGGGSFLDKHLKTVILKYKEIKKAGELPEMYRAPECSPGVSESALQQELIALQSFESSIHL